MKDLKIRVINKAESKEAQELFFELGFEKKSASNHYPSWISNFEYLNGRIQRYTSEPSESWALKCKEITLQELRDMVVLKRNNQKDANVYQDGDISCLYDLYLTENKELYFYHCGKKAWILSNLNHDKDYYELLKPIKDGVMKEYLFKYNNQYTLVELSKEDAESNPEQYIEVPEGSIKATFCNGYLIFWKDDFLSLSVKNGDTDFTFNEDDDYGFVEYMDINDDALVVWQREKESIIDKLVVDDLPELKHGIDATLAERQAQYGCFEDVARTTEQIMEAMAKVRVNGLKELPYPHRMALYMIASKMARIVNGDFNHKDSWHDIGGYSKLIEDLIGDSNEI